MKPILIIVGVLLGLGIITAVTLNIWMNSRTFQVAGEIINRVNTDQKVIALTFDDGPNEKTEALLEILADNQVKGTFYLIGKDIEEFPEESKQIVAAGHEVGNHSYSHQRMVFKFNNFIIPEIEKTNKLLRAAGFEDSITFRPPYGKKLITLPLYLESQEIKTITWDVDPNKAIGDKARPSEIVDYIVNHTKPGSIILLHPWYDQFQELSDALPTMISALKANDYEFVTVSELLKFQSPKK